MRAHHLVPFNIIGENLRLATLASEAGWDIDGPENLIELPADEKTQTKYFEETGKLRPIQNSSHPVYDLQTQEQIESEQKRIGDPLTPLAARTILERVAARNRLQIESYVWLPRLR
jgi:hypothetical protein